MIDEQSSASEPIQETNRSSENRETSTSSAAEAFRRLESAIWKVHDEILSIGSQGRDEGNTRVVDEEVARLKGKLSLLESIFQIHDLLFKRVVSMEAGEWAPDPFVMDLLKHIENELERHEVFIVRPEPGDIIDLKYMHTQKDIPARFWRKSNTVAKVHSCGFTTKIQDIEKVLKMAVVDVYRKKNDVLEEK